MQAELEALRAGSISFEEFQSRTIDTWRRLAKYLLRRWPSPAGVDVDDLVQELLLAAWNFAPRFDAKRGSSLRSFIVFNACDKAKKWLHQQRNAYRRDDKSPGRYPACFSSLTNDEGFTFIEYLCAVPPAEDLLVVLENDQEERQRRRNAMTKTAEMLEDELDQMLILAIAESDGDIDDAVTLVWSNPRACLALRVDDEAGIRRALRRVLKVAAAVAA